MESCSSGQEVEGVAVGWFQLQRAGSSPCLRHLWNCFLSIVQINGLIRSKWHFHQYEVTWSWSWCTSRWCLNNAKSFQILKKKKERKTCVTPEASWAFCCSQWSVCVGLSGSCIYCLWRHITQRMHKRGVEVKCFKFKTQVEREAKCVANLAVGSSLESRWRIRPVASHESLGRQ